MGALLLSQLQPLSLPHLYIFSYLLQGRVCPKMQPNISFACGQKISWLLVRARDMAVQFAKCQSVRLKSTQVAPKKSAQ